MAKKGKLSPKQRRFVENYTITRNATKAAVAAGYSEKTAGQQGHRLLKNVEISTAIEQAFSKASAQAEVDAAWVLASLRENAERAMQAIPVLDKDGNETGEWTWHPSAANRSLELLGKHAGLWKNDKGDKDDAPKLVIEVIDPTKPRSTK